MLLATASVWNVQGALVEQLYLVKIRLEWRLFQLIALQYPDH